MLVKNPTENNDHLQSSRYLISKPINKICINTRAETKNNEHETNNADNDKNKTNTTDDINDFHHR